MPSFYVDKNICLLYHDYGDIVNIKKIIKLKNGKYKIKLDDYEFETYDDVIIKYNLLYKKQLDNNLLKRISNDSIYYDNYNKVLKFATLKVRCEKEVKDYLHKLEISETDGSKIISKLKSINLLNDRIYTRSYINDRILLSKDGINKIKKDLIENSIDLNVVEDEISKIDINLKDKLESLIIKKIKANHKYSEYLLKNKIIREMINLGYNYDDIVELYDNNKIDDYDILIREYHKLFSKYSNKYHGYELEHIIKNKLYSKGFQYNDIKKEDLL